MKQHYHCQYSWLNTDEQNIAYRIYTNNYHHNFDRHNFDHQSVDHHNGNYTDHKSGRRLLLLHGAGVAGEDTWSHIVQHLGHWSEVLVPDIRGMGGTKYPDDIERPYVVEEALADIISLLDHLCWWAVDVAGYSFGGLLSMLLKSEYPIRVHKQYLLEPALLDRASSDDTAVLRDKYLSAADMLRHGSDPQPGILYFLDTISPNRIISPKTEHMIASRLAERALGFANALDAATEASRRLDRQTLIDAQKNVSCFIGGRSVDELHKYHKQLAHDRDDWFYHSIRGCDHSLPFQKPRQIAQQMNEDMTEYLRYRPVD